jgi:hypothetical protein
MEYLHTNQTKAGAPDEVDPGNYNVQQGENLVGLLFVFKDKSNPLLHYEHWYLYEKIQGDKWPLGSAKYTFPSRANPRVVTTLSRNSDEPSVQDPSQPSRDAFGFSRYWTEQGITARYILAKAEEQSPVGSDPVYRQESLLDG